MSIPLALATALASGILLGVFVFGGLWWTVRHGLASANPAAWFAISALLRLAAVIVTFYNMVLVGAPSVLACLLGLLFARFVITQLIRSNRSRRIPIQYS
jgi:F1F0 ATPase subunit 2